MPLPRHLEAHQAELSVLGGILLDNNALDRVADRVGPTDFHSPAHRTVFTHMAALAEANQPIDPVTVAQTLERSSELDGVGGLPFLLSLSEGVATSVNVEHHARIIHDAAEVRRLIRAASGIIEKATSGDYEESSQLFDEAQQAIYDIGSQGQASSLVSMNDAVKEVVDLVRKAFETKASVTGTPTGFVDLDSMTAGLQPGDLLIVAGRPAMGKTTLALNMATNAATMGQCSVALFSLEMPTTQLVTRMLASEARVESSGMRTGHLTDDDLHRILSSVKTMRSWPVYIDDTPNLTVMEARAKCRRLASDKGIPPLGLVIVDYLQLMKGSGAIRSREQEISEISRNLKALAKEIKVPVMALSQLNRSLESRPNKRPIMSDLRESGAIEQDADVIMFVYRDEVYNEDTPEKGIAEVIIGKHRNGPTGTCRLKFFKQWTRFDNLARE